jgi:hypothetical protein
VSEYANVQLLFGSRRSDEWNGRGHKPRTEINAMKYFTIDAANTITLHASRRVARKTGSGVFSTEEQLADLIGPDSRRLVDVWNNLPGVKPVAPMPSSA